jgi:hypothetical protein
MAGTGRTGADDGVDVAASWISAQIGQVRSAVRSDLRMGAFLPGATAGEPSVTCATTWVPAGVRSQSSMWLNVKRNWTARATRAKREPNRIFDRNQRIFWSLRAPVAARGVRANAFRQRPWPPRGAGVKEANPATFRASRDAGRNLRWGLRNLRGVKESAVGGKDGAAGVRTSPRQSAAPPAARPGAARCPSRRSGTPRPAAALPSCTPQRGCRS